MARVLSHTVRVVRLLGSVAVLSLLALLPIGIGNLRGDEIGWLPSLALFAGGLVALGLVAWRGQWFEPWLRQIRQRRRPYLTPLQLPPPPRLFLGRDDEVGQIQRHLLGTGSGEPSTVVVHGDAGIGKTVLAVHVAHRVAEKFPDGQLFAHVALPQERLHRSDSEQVDLVVHEVLGRFVSALQGPGDKVPRRADARIRRYRSLTRRRRVLVVLDDADHLAVIKALLPAGSGCAVIVTSRAALGSLPPTWRDVPLGPLAPDHARHVMRVIAGQRVDEESPDTDELLEATRLHPLSVQIAATALAASPSITLDAAVERMRSVRLSGRRRSLPHAGALDLTYGLLTPEEQRTLRMIGLLGRREFAAWMLGELLGVDDQKAARLADRLVHVGLLERVRENSAGVPVFAVPEHVLSYAQSRRYERSSEQQQAERLLKALARRLREREGRHGPTAADIDRVVFVRLRTGRIYEALSAAREQLALARDAGDGASIAYASSAFAEVRMEVGSFEAAVDLAYATLNEPAAPATAQARALRCLGRLHRQHRQVGSSERRLSQAVDAATRADDRPEQTRALRELAVTQALRRQPQKAVDTVSRALELCAHKGDSERPGTLLAAGTVYLATDRRAEAVEKLSEARREARQQRQVLVEAWTGLESARLQLAAQAPGPARDHAFEAMELFAKMNHRYGKAHCRLLVGGSYLAGGQIVDAVSALEEALENFGSCGDRWAEGRAAYLLAVAHQRAGRRVDAGVLFRAAAANFEDVGDQTGIRETRARLAPRGSVPSGRAAAGPRPTPALLAPVDGW